MFGTVWDRTVLIDTAAVVALQDRNDRFHESAKAYFGADSSVRWAALDATAHEAYTHMRYEFSYPRASEAFEFLRSGQVELIRFTQEDEESARALLEKYREHDLSFHDALCASVMIRLGIFQVFTFDSHFWTFGFQVKPGDTD